MGWECLEMVRKRLEQLGLSMDGCPPMMYDDAIRSLAARLGKRAGFKTWGEVADAVRQGAKDAEPFACDPPRKGEFAALAAQSGGDQ